LHWKKNDSQQAPTHHGPSPRWWAQNTDTCWEQLCFERLRGGACGVWHRGGTSSQLKKSCLCWEHTQNGVCAQSLVPTFAKTNSIGVGVSTPYRLGSK
jgi:hypothetical protein